MLDGMEVGQDTVQRHVAGRVHEPVRPLLSWTERIHKDQTAEAFPSDTVAS